MRRLLRTQEVLGSWDKRLKLTQFRGAGRRLAYQVSLTGEAVTLPLSRRSLSRMTIARCQRLRTHEERKRYLRDL